MFVALCFIDGSDYIAVTQTLVFDQDTTTFSIDVTILDDLINEPTESFLGRLTTTDPDVRFSIQEQTLFIVDDDGAYRYRAIISTVKPVYNGRCISRSPLYNSQVTESQMGLQCAF